MNEQKLLALRPGLAGRLACLAEATSTLDVARGLLAQGLERPVVLADRQTAGRGRKGRSFSSPAGAGLYLSMGLPLPGGALPPTLRMACGVCRALSELCGRDLAIKWVNDLLLEEKKICGILAEGLGDRVVLGVGVNVNTPADFFGGELAHVSSLAALCGQSFVLEEVAAAVIGELEAAWEEREDSLLTYYKERLITLGREVRVIDGDREQMGRAVDLAADGSLLVRFAGEDAATPVVCGDVSVRGLWGYV